MNRRTFWKTCSLTLGAQYRSFNLSAQSNVQNAAKNDYPENQHPDSARGRTIAEFARSLNIKRGIVYRKRPQNILTLDIYQPRNRPSHPLPCVLAFGLSAFRINETAYRWNLDRLPPAPTANLYPPFLAHNRVVIVANLRVSTQARWPAQIHDAKCAMRWIRKNAGDLQIDPDRIAAFGASASATISALLALTADSGQLDDPICDPSISTKVKAVCCLSGLYDLEYYKNVDYGNRSLFVDVLPPYVGKDDALYRESSPSTYVHPGAPPFLLTHGRQDQRVPYSQMPHFAALLKKAGVTVETEPIDNYQHGPLASKEPNPGYEVTDRIIDHFLKRYLDPKA